MSFVPFSKVQDFVRGKRVALVGSAPSVLDNRPGEIDRHAVVVRVNNYKLHANTGYRTDAHYSFYGSSIRKSALELQRDGVKLCICKCPNSQPIESEWHVQRGKLTGIDFRYIYELRKSFWFCDTYVPDDSWFMSKFSLLENHIATTGFSAIIDLVACKPSSIFLTGFDFFRSGMHNVNERWREGDANDPIGHKPEAELDWLLKNHKKYPLVFDQKLSSMINSLKAVA